MDDSEGSTGSTEESCEEQQGNPTTNLSPEDVAAKLGAALATPRACLTEVLRRLFDPSAT